MTPSEPDLAATENERCPTCGWTYPAPVLAALRAALAAANPHPRVLSEAELAEMTAAAIDPATAPERLERLNAVLAAARSSPAPAEGLDVERLAEAMNATADELDAEPWSAHNDGGKKFIARLIAAEYARLAPPSPEDPEEERWPVT